MVVLSIVELNSGASTGSTVELQGRDHVGVQSGTTVYLHVDALDIGWSRHRFHTLSFFFLLHFPKMGPVFGPQKRLVAWRPNLQLAFILSFSLLPPHIGQLFLSVEAVARSCSCSSSLQSSVLSNDHHHFLFSPPAAPSYILVFDQHPTNQPVLPLLAFCKGAMLLQPLALLLYLAKLLFFSCSIRMKRKEAISCTCYFVLEPRFLLGVCKQRAKYCA